MHDGAIGEHEGRDVAAGHPADRHLYRAFDGAGGLIQHHGGQVPADRAGELYRRAVGADDLADAAPAKGDGHAVVAHTRADAQAVGIALANHLPQRDRVGGLLEINVKNVHKLRHCTILQFIVLGGVDAVIRVIRQGFSLYPPPENHTNSVGR